ncbi:MAG: hypothetical protein UR39_C0010G0023 [Candidatus Woesebacteria bacterium GW2011_GWA1_33_30]|uniref:DUF6922 domain-containing protein n=1 Tax=Candidatus Woesebacteria bacterium GW2011_GWA2_33_28 TaxID=1618561 RepID=A0A0G0CT73_9BACT|nr:MAG: hypothetical protein UR38_C0010G0023 [Candidatus Woesebacteria bacterium GW2011_GWA2_33_28]KKP47281.1 MAG: hypothetical protein UR39_C0010G0023 [Candidatus Woesebacteria bacterium GW2011_GWA1_33_30]KKP48927.1 MAG: hypothetical protein UR40_C0011G0023 [Microgenomates group bacterium GW2011_GWC1_33_32]KKP51465.1 MAG: hypothetical protein UR44_C0010G0023 [Candidatus Woesebacteria bacterium GW2011_GWB1_33_38]KKP56859.1 MAG: hypothetical protein UR48_C0027G0003 [Microgenomates group bacteriu
MSIPKFLQTYLASYDLSKMDIQRDKDIIITEILNKGDGKALDWLVKSYKRNEIKEIVSKPVRGSWMRSVLDYWIKVFDLDIPKLVYNKSIINLNPY